MFFDLFEDFPESYCFITNKWYRLQIDLICMYDALRFHYLIMEKELALARNSEIFSIIVQKAFVLNTIKIVLCSVLEG